MARWRWWRHFRQQQQCGWLDRKRSQVLGPLNVLVIGRGHYGKRKRADANAGSWPVAATIFIPVWTIEPFRFGMPFNANREATFIAFAKTARTRYPSTERSLPVSSVSQRGRKLSKFPLQNRCVPLKLLGNVVEQRVHWLGQFWRVLVISRMQPSLDMPQFLCKFRNYAMEGYVYELCGHSCGVSLRNYYVRNAACRMKRDTQLQTSVYRANAMKFGARDWIAVNYFVQCTGALYFGIFLPYTMGELSRLQVSIGIRSVQGICLYVTDRINVGRIFLGFRNDDTVEMLLENFSWDDV